MLAMIPTTAALNPPSTTSAFGVVPNRVYAQASTSTAMRPGKQNPE